MIISHADRLRALILVLLLAATPAIADPSDGEAESSPIADEGVFTPGPARQAGGSSRFEVRELTAPDPEAVGILDDRHGGLGSGLWGGTAAATVRRLVPRLPVAESRAMRALTRRLLLTAAIAPDKIGVETPSLLELRAERLAALGETEGLTALMKAVPSASASPALARIRAETLLLSGDNKAACAEIAARGPDDSRFKVFCALSSGKVLEANMALDLMRDRKESDATFVVAADAMAGTPPPKLDKLPVLTPLHLAAFRAAKIPLPLETVPTLAPGSLGAVIANPVNSLDTRLLAAERAEALGLLDTDTLRRLYAELTFNAAEAQLAQSQGDRTPRGRALLLRSIPVEASPAVRAGLIVRVLAAAAERGAFPATARLYAPLIADLAPTPDLAPSAPSLARAQIAAGRPDAAGPWLALARSDPAAAKAAKSVALLYRLALPGADPAPIELPSGDGLAPDAVSRRAEVLLSLLAGVGEKIPSGLWLSSLRDPSVAPALVPRSALRIMARAAAEDVRTGETVLLTLVGLGDGGLDRADPEMLNRAVTHLRMIGLEREARALAVEAAFANGL
ncbi:hypothetical protein [Magnetospirillum molischianum]|uniref:Antifreeze glycopeptide polyprotein n=1 Tax=Magnetospirillum molischianum DSM 120 TaxID=1150626 RepID=H8FX68_MAGML|nr:hypothetical protein [Magnetospirillum molischianum]CCG42956.1 Antifreeze glycopeptide polyprotein [Magnetospirillum molischianum DSM 120]